MEELNERLVLKVGVDYGALVEKLNRFKINFAELNKNDNVFRYLV